MDPSEGATGTRDEHYDLISVLYHALHGAETAEVYAADAEATGDERLAAFFREARGRTWGWPNKRRGCSASLRVRQWRKDILRGPNRLTEGYLWGTYRHGRPSRGGRPRHPDRGERPLPRPRRPAKTSRRRERQSRPTLRHKAKTRRHR